MWGWEDHLNRRKSLATNIDLMLSQFRCQQPNWQTPAPYSTRTHLAFRTAFSSLWHRLNVVLETFGRGFCSILMQQHVCSGFVNHTCRDANLPAVAPPHPQRSSIRSRAGGYGGHLSHRELITLFKMTGALCHGVMCCCWCLHPQLNKLFVDAAMRSCMQAVYKCKTHSQYPKITMSCYGGMSLSS